VSNGYRAHADVELVGEALTLPWQRISVAKPKRRKAATKPRSSAKTT
jgi:hypothetical protein